MSLRLSCQNHFQITFKVEGFKDCITKWWESFVFKGTSSFVLVEKLKALKHKLKSWNKEVFGRVEDRKKTTL